MLAHATDLGIDTTRVVLACTSAEGSLVNVSQLIRIRVTVICFTDAFQGGWTITST
jgi:hypothetical protein